MGGRKRDRDMENGREVGSAWKGADLPHLPTTVGASHVQVLRRPRQLGQLLDALVCALLEHLGALVHVCPRGVEMRRLLPRSNQASPLTPSLLCPLFLSSKLRSATPSFAAPVRTLPLHHTSSHIPPMPTACQGTVLFLLGQQGGLWSSRYPRSGSGPHGTGERRRSTRSPSAASKSLDPWVL